MVVLPALTVVPAGMPAWPVTSMPASGGELMASAKVSDAAPAGASALPTVPESVGPVTRMSTSACGLMAVPKGNAVAPEPTAKVNVSAVLAGTCAVRPVAGRVKASSICVEVVPALTVVPTGMPAWPVTCMPSTATAAIADTVTEVASAFAVPVVVPARPAQVAVRAAMPRAPGGSLTMTVLSVMTLAAGTTAMMPATAVAAKSRSI